MFPLHSQLHSSHLILSLALLATTLMSGCATTATTTFETTMHSGDTSFRLQSCDVTARVQVEFKRG